jgi:hypothetical protein
MSNFDVDKLKVVLDAMAERIAAHDTVTFYIPGELMPISDATEAELAALDDAGFEWRDISHEDEGEPRFSWIVGPAYDRVEVDDAP